MAKNKAMDHDDHGTAQQAHVKASNETKWKGMHGGTVSGKWFESTRRNRISHAMRRARIVERSIGKK